MKNTNSVVEVSGLLSVAPISVTEAASAVISYFDAQAEAMTAAHLDGWVRCKFISEVMGKVLKDVAFKSAALDNYDEGYDVAISGVKVAPMEAAVKYDYIGTGDPVIAELYAKMAALKLVIKEREEFLRTVPASGIQVGFTESFVDEETGELKEYNKLYDVHPPVRQSERTLKVTLKK